MMRPQVQSISLHNFKCFNGTYSFGPFGTLTAIHGNIGVGKSIMFEGLAFVLGESFDNLGANYLHDIIAEYQNDCSVSVVLAIPGETIDEDEPSSQDQTSSQNQLSIENQADNQNQQTLKFTKQVLQEEDEDGVMGPHFIQYLLDDEIVNERTFIEELKQLKLVHNGMYFAVQNSRNHIAIEKPEVFGDYFHKVFRLEDLQNKYRRSKKKFNTEEKRMDHLNKIEEAIKAEKQKAVQYVLIRLYACEKSIHVQKSEILKTENEIKNIRDEMVMTARGNYFRSKPKMMQNNKMLIAQKEQHVKRLNERLTHHQTRWNTFFQGARLDKLKLPMRPRVNRDDRDGKYYAINYSSLPESELVTAKECDAYLVNTVNELNKLRRDWPKLHNIHDPNWQYVKLYEREEEHNKNYVEGRKAYDEAKKEFNEVKQQYTTKFKRDMGIFARDIDEMHKAIYDDPLRDITLELVDENDFSEGIMICSHTEFIKDQPILQLSGGEKKLIEISMLCAIVKMTETPFFFIDNIDTNFHYRTFPHLLNFLKTKSESLCQIAIISRNAGVYRRCPTSIRVMEER